jgi:rare lipoprotein A
MPFKIILYILINIATIVALSFCSISKASYYGSKHHGKKTASGKIFNKDDLTCAASSYYNLGDSLLVTNVNNGKSVRVEVTDRGNFQKYGRCIDLSEASFKKISKLSNGVITVSIEKIK